MIELSRQQIHRIRSTFRQTVGRSSSRRTTPITFEGTPQELRIRAVSDRVAIEHRVPGRFPTVAFAVSFEALAACEGRREDPVRFELADGQVALHWTDANIPQTVRFPTVEPIALPEPPSEFAPIERTFLAAMADACATTDAESQRYALSCVRLRGADGQIAATDAAFLDQAAQRLPGAGEMNSPVTLDLNGAVVIRAKSGEQSSVTDLVLRNSRRQGDELKVSSNREYVRRAIQLGFRELHFRDAEAPAFCRDDNRTYFWAVLGKEAVLKPDASATRIESPSVGRSARVGPTKPATSPSQQSPLPDPIRNRITMPTPTTNRIQQSTTDAAGANGKSLSALIDEGEQLRATLREVLSRTNALVVGLKRQRQQSNAMRTALKSLRAMQAIEV